jgi:beta-phosphoglucomutase-like phosphatase (HAD superfamily)
LVATSAPQGLPGLALQAVLFDMDGTLLDSEKVWDVALDDLAAWLGGELSATARRRMVGSSVARSVAILHSDLGIEADPESSGGYLIDRTAGRTRHLDPSPAHRNRTRHARARVLRRNGLR